MALNINFDFQNYLQNKLGVKYVVSNVRNLDGEINGEITNVVITKLPSNVFSYHSVLEYQIDFYTDKPETIEDELYNFVSDNNGIGFVNAFNVFYPLFTTPTPMEKDVAIGSNFYTRFVIFGKITVFNEVSDIRKLEIDGEQIDFLTISLPYNVQFSSVKRSGQELNGSVKEIASTQLTFSTVPQSSKFFFSKIKRIRQGLLSGQTAFAIKLTFTDETIEEYTMICTTSILNSGRGLVPSTNFTFAVE